MTENALGGWVPMIGRRVEIHPATDAWMQGDRFGEIVSVGRKFLHVKMDRSGRTLNLRPTYIYEVVGDDAPILHMDENS